MVLVLMGVSGTGKTTVGKILAADLGWDFVEGDDFHPAANVQAARPVHAYFDSALKKFTANEPIVRTPTTSARSSTKNLGLWLGAAVVGPLR
jgi:shikimate kinase